MWHVRFFIINFVLIGLFGGDPSIYKGKNVRFFNEAAKNVEFGLSEAVYVPGWDSQKVVIAQGGEILSNSPNFLKFVWKKQEGGLF